MKALTLKTSTGNSRIEFGDAKMLLLGEMEKTHALVIADSRVAELHKDKLPEEKATFKLKASEKNKTMKSVEKIHAFFLESNADRHSRAIAIGGGIVLDIAGFAASTYMRGIRFSYVPTTLLAMADASIGGKTGVNLLGYKNTVGTFALPERVVIDTGFLETLPESEFMNGLAEIIKHGIISDRKLFWIVETKMDRILKRDEKLLKNIILRSINAKAQVVKKDVKEKELRKILNFGHTVGHALEKTELIPHGLAVAKGMMKEAEISEMLGILGAGECKRIRSALQNYGFDLRIRTSASKLIRAVQKDKKKNQNYIDFVALRGIGKPKVISLTIAELKKLLE